MVGVPQRSVKRVPLGAAVLLSYNPASLPSFDIDQQRPAVAITLRSFLETLERFRTHHRRQLPFMAPALERRRPRIAAEDYAARHSIEHTLDRKAELRRLAPTLPPAAMRYHQLLKYELEGLREVVTALHSATEGRELQECLFEAAVQMERLEIEIAWCEDLLGTERSPIIAS